MGESGKRCAFECDRRGGVGGGNGILAILAAYLLDIVSAVIELRSY